MKLHIVAQSQTNGKTCELKAFWHPFENFAVKLAALPLWKNSEERIRHADVQERLCNVDLWCWTGSVEAAECVLLHHNLRWMIKLGVSL